MLIFAVQDAVEMNREKLLVRSALRLAAMDDGKNLQVKNENSIKKITAGRWTKKKISFKANKNWWSNGGRQLMNRDNKFLSDLHMHDEI